MAKRISNEILMPSLEMYKNGISVAIISEELGVSKNTIRRFLKEKGIVFKYTKPKQTYEEAMTMFLSQEDNFTIFCDKNSISRKWFGEFLIKQGVDYSSTKPKFNQHIFDLIDSEEKAYWLGFIYADGYISASSLDKDKEIDYKFELNLSSKDITHLEKFNKFMEHTDYNINISDVILNENTYERARWSIGNKHMWNVLNNYGCTPRKSNTLTFPDVTIFNKKSLVFDFIRGYIDGDGSISYNNIEHTKMSVNILGTSEFLMGIQHHLGTNNALSYNNKTQSEITKVLSFVGSSAYNQLNKLYKNATIYLDRKYKRYLEICRLYE